MKRFDGGKDLKQLHPIVDMEFEYDEDTDELNINELLEAKDKVNEEL